MLPPTQTGENGGDAKLTFETVEDMNTEVDIAEVLQESQVMEVLYQLDQELVGLKSVKTRIREIAALLQIDRMRHSLGLSARPPSLHMSFTGPPGTGKTTVAMRMATILHRLPYPPQAPFVPLTPHTLLPP